MNSGTLTLTKAGNFLRFFFNFVLCDFFDNLFKRTKHFRMKIRCGFLLPFSEAKGAHKTLPLDRIHFTASPAALFHCRLTAGPTQNRFVSTFTHNKLIKLMESIKTINPIKLIPWTIPIK